MPIKGHNRCDFEETKFLLDAKTTTNSNGRKAKITIVGRDETLRRLKTYLSF